MNGLKPRNFRSPQIDLDSLYGLGPIKEPHLYQDNARLKVGETIADGFVRRTFLNDLPRKGGDDQYEAPQALIPDARNDENLVTAQTHLAFARFHNRVVDSLQQGNGFVDVCPIHGRHCPPDQLFNCARREVVQHFQAIILEDFLPRILDDTGMECIKRGSPRFFDIDSREGVFMPLEFSVAAFRFGHSMVRSKYEWNYYQCSEPDRNGPVDLRQLFGFTQFRGDLGGAPRLSSDWIIDWRRFYDFTELGYRNDGRKKNFARRIDTAFNLHLDQIPNFPHAGFPPEQSSITVRNLLRGYSLGLPTGEEVAEYIDAIKRLTTEEVTSGLHKDLLSDPAFHNKTPLWYYVLKEAELNEQGKLGSVGSCIVAETLVGLIKKSPHSILNLPDWRPKFGLQVKPFPTRRYRMIDLLQCADVVDPVGEYVARRL
jgi:hypothetical protein